MILTLTFEYLKDWVSTKVKASLMNIDYNNMDFKAFVWRVQDISTKLENLHHKSTSWTNQNQNLTRLPFKSVNLALTVATSSPVAFATTPHTASIAMGIYLGPIDLSSAGKYGPLSQEEKDCRNWLRLCRYCGQAGHITFNCSLAKQCITNVNEFDVISTGFNTNKQRNVSSLSQVAPGDK